MNVVILILISDTVYKSDYTDSRLLATSWSQAIDPFRVRYEEFTFPGDETIYLFLQARIRRVSVIRFTHTPSLVQWIKAVM